MIPLRKVSLLLLVGVLAGLLLSPAPAATKKRQPLPPLAPAKPRPAKLVPGTGLPVDHELQSKLEAAADYIQTEDWDEATRLLQFLLDRKSDSIVPIQRKDAGGREVWAYVSLRVEAQRLVAALPAKGREFYRVKVGPKAADLLKAAKSPGMLAEITRRYLYTPSGPEAVQRLARHYAAARDYPLAAARYAQLLRHRGIARWLPEELYEATVAFLRTGDKQHGDRTARELLARASGIPLRIGKRTFTPEQLTKELAALAPPSGRKTWPIFRGNAQRDAQGIGGTAFLGKKPHWGHPLVREPESTGRWIKKAEDKLVQTKQPVLPAFFPVTASGPVKGGRVGPLLLYRSFWGIHAVEMKTGRLTWEAGSPWGLDRMLGSGSDARKVRALEQWLQYYIDQGQRPGIIFENSVAAGLSTDDTFLYAIEDLAVPPPHRVDADGEETPARGHGAEIGAAVQQNKLMAFSLAGGGKLTWTLGDPEDEKGLQETCFLGPPLPLDGKLYILAETKQELRLIVIDPRAPDDVNGFSPRVLSVQPLVKPKKKLTEDPFRRLHALHPAFSRGILVCPTNAGVVVGLDLLSNTLAWTFRYREKGAPDPDTKPGFARRWPPPGFRVGPDGRLYPLAPPHKEWRVAPPIIQDGKVIFTAPDSQSVHCLNLRDGSPVWARKREESDLYLAGVFKDRVLIVGKKSCRALSLADGTTVWTLETGLPSGQGVASDNVYYLPLCHGPKNKDPEICAIDVPRGMIVAHTRSRYGEVPGNLLFFEGDVVSQTHQQVVAYPQLRVKIAQMDALIAKNPNDPLGLTERGELRLDKGDLAGAIADLSRALKNTPPADVRLKAREKLYDTLTEFFQRDFNRAEEYIKEYEELCKIDMTGATGDEKLKKEAEARQRRFTYLLLVGRGREVQGKYREALRTYLELVSLAPGADMLSPPDDPGVKVRWDVWVRQRIGELLRKAPAAQRKEMEEEIDRRLKKVGGGKDLAGLRGFIALFGPESAAGREARLLLARELTALGKDFLEADRALQEVRRRRDDPARAARALLGLAKLQVRRGLLADGVYYYRILARDYPTAIVEDGKTGKELYEELAADKRFLPYFDEPGKAAWLGRIKVTENRDTFRMEYQALTFAHAGESLPFFRRHQLRLRFDYHQLKLTDTRTDEDRWTRALSRTLFQNIVGSMADAPRLRFSYQTIGDLIILPVGHRVFGIDPVGRRVLWEKNLHGDPEAPELPGRVAYSYVHQAIDPRDGTLRLTYPDGWMQWLGAPLVLTPAALCLVTHNGLTAVDPLTGRALWRRADVSPNSRLFGDGQLAYVVEIGEGGKVTNTRAFRIADGRTVRVPDFSAVFEQRLRVPGGQILAADTGPRDTVVLRQYDIRTGKDVWQHTYPAKSLVLQAVDTPLAGVVEREGKVHIHDPLTGKELFNGTLPPRQLDKVRAGFLLADSHNFYVIGNRPTDQALMPFGGVQRNFVPGTGQQVIPINGWVYAFRRKGGKLRWFQEVSNQMLVRIPFADIPMLLFTSRYQKWQVSDGARKVVQVVSVKSFDKRTGKLLLDMNNPGMPQFHALLVDPPAGRVSLVSYNLKITFQVVPRE